MDVERAMVSVALNTGQIHVLLAHGIQPSHFSRTLPQSDEVAKVYEWAVKYTREHGISPSFAMLRLYWPDWRPEPSQDPLEALCQEFIGMLRERHWRSKMVQLAQVDEHAQRHKLDEIFLEAAREFMALSPSTSVGRLSDMRTRVDQYEAKKESGETRGKDLGIPIFDDLTNGAIRPGRVITFSGFSGRGKSTISQFVIVNAYDQGATGLICALEMSKEEVFERLDTMIMNFSNRALTHYELPEEHLDYWRVTAERYKKARNDIVVVPGRMSIDSIYAEINRYKPDLTVVDYIQLMTREDKRSRWEYLEEMANEFKQIAMSTNSSIIIVSQDSRGAAQTGSTETTVGGSIAIFQASDVYIGMHQDDDMKQLNKVQLRMLKNRSGPPGEVDLFWHPDTMTFERWEDRHKLARFAK